MRSDKKGAGLMTLRLFREKRVSYVTDTLSTETGVGNVTPNVEGIIVCCGLKRFGNN